MMQNKKGIFKKREREERTDPLSECHSSETAKLQLTLLQKSTCVKIKKNKTVKMLAPSPNFGRAASENVNITPDTKQQLQVSPNWSKWRQEA